MLLFLRNSYRTHNLFSYQPYYYFHNIKANKTQGGRVLRTENAELKARLEKLEQRIGAYALAVKAE